MKFFIYSLLFSLLFSLGAKLQVFVNYFVNQSYYAEVLCKNKTVKNSCCKGKCAVEKELLDLTAKEEDQNPGTQNALFKFSKVEEALCTSLKLNLPVATTFIFRPPFLVKITNGYTSSLLKPPLI